MNLAKISLAVAVALVLSTPASAVIIPLTASMDGAQANAGAGTGSPGIGVAGPPAVGNAIITASQENDLLAGLLYVNLHTTAFSGGEIRGQVTVVPEPTTLTLLALGLGLVAVGRRSAHR